MGKVSLTAKFTAAFAGAAALASAFSVSPVPAMAQGGPSSYHAMSPTRVLDTREGIGSRGQIGPQGTLSLPVAGKNGVPADAVAVALNVTVTETSAPGFLTAFPSGQPVPLASNLNWLAGETRPNLVQVAIGPDGNVNFYNSNQPVSVIADLEGYYAALVSPSASGLYRPLTPARVLDTRDGRGGVSSPVGEGQAIALNVLGKGNVPPAGVSAVSLNVTVTGSNSDSYLTVFPYGQSRPLASNLNWAAGDTVPNRVIVPVGRSGAVAFYNKLGSVDVLADVNGWFTDGTDARAIGGAFTPVTPFRALDTRDGTGSAAGRVGPYGSASFAAAGINGVPPDASAVAMNVTATDASSPSFAAVYPAGGAVPFASDMNYKPGSSAPNLSLAKPGDGGRASVYNRFGETHFVADVFGWYGAVAGDKPAPVAPSNLTAEPVSSNAVTLRWTAPPPSGGSSLVSYEARGDDGSVATAYGEAASLTVGGLPCGRNYSYSVRALNGYGSSPASSTASAYLSCPPPPPPPAASPAPPPPPPPGPPPGGRSNYLRLPTTGFDRQLLYYNDCSGYSGMGYSTGYYASCYRDRMVLIGHNPGPFSAVANLAVGDPVSYWDPSGTLRNLHVTNKRVFGYEQSFAAISHDPSTLIFYACYSADTNYDWVIDAN